MTELSFKSLIKLFYILSHVQLHRLLQKMIQNPSSNHYLRKLFVMTFVSFLNNDMRGAILSVKLLVKGRGDCYGSYK